MWFEALHSYYRLTKVYLRERERERERERVRERVVHQKDFNIFCLEMGHLRVDIYMLRAQHRTMRNKSEYLRKISFVTLNKILFIRVF